MLSFSHKSICEVWRELMFHSSSFQRCWVGLRSTHCAGQLSSTPNWENRLFMKMALCNVKQSWKYTNIIVNWIIKISIIWILCSTVLLLVTASIFHRMTSSISNVCKKRPEKITLKTKWQPPYVCQPSPHCHLDILSPRPKGHKCIWTEVSSYFGPCSVYVFTTILCVPSRLHTGERQTQDKQTKKLQQVWWLLRIF